MYALLSHYYGFTPDQISELTPAQLKYYLEMIRYVSPDSKDSGKSPPYLPEDFIREAKAKGIPIPDVIPTGPPVEDDDEDNDYADVQQTMGGESVYLGDD